MALGNANNSKVHKLKKLTFKIFLMSTGDAEKIFEVGEKTFIKCYGRQFDEIRCNAYVKKKKIVLEN